MILLLGSNIASNYITLLLIIETLVIYTFDTHCPYLHDPVFKL